MNQTDDKVDVVAKAIAARQEADQLRGEAIAKLLEQREQLQENLKLLGYTGNQPLNGHGGRSATIAIQQRKAEQGKRFKKLTLAQIGKILLAEHGSLHGTKIEELAKAGGFKGGTKHFQNYMPVAFKRDGGFVNVGKNTWTLKSESKTG
ncbi:MAG TPA: hypothetical protein VEU96_26440 [Bryobacteraceae bacterium]|nr:hypothetical protein [Bryobacteraceae bacterium]